MKKSSERVLRYREAGAIRRCHTIRTLSVPTLAEHCYNFAMLVEELYPDKESPSFLRLIRYALLHDVAERHCGDSPAGLSYFDEDIQEARKRAQKVVENSFEIPVPELTEDERRWAKALDQLEFYLWLHDELALGNRHIEPYIDGLKDWFEGTPDVPDPVFDFYLTFKWKRTPQRLP